MSAEEKSRRWSPRTLVAQAMGRVDAATRAIVAPIHVATTYPLSRQRVSFWVFLWTAGQSDRP